MEDQPDVRRALSRAAAIDITWGTGLCYFGIPFQTDWIADLLKQRAAIGSSERQVLSYRCQLSLRIDARWVESGDGAWGLGEMGRRLRNATCANTDVDLL